MKKAKKLFTIEGMHCSSCAMTIDFDLEDRPGVVRSITSYAKQETVVEFNEGEISEEEIVTQIQKTGYNARKKSAS